MRVWLIVILFFCTVSAYSQIPSLQTPSSKNISLGGKIGLGMSQISGITPGVSVRYWLSDQTALDFFGGQLLFSNDIFDFGVGIKTNLSAPSRDILIQGIVHASYTHTIYVPFFFSTNDAYDLSFGLGFEAFMPFCKWLSIEDSILFDFAWRPSPYGQVIGMFLPSGNGLALTPLNLSIHAYF